MVISYRPLWILLINRGLKKTDLVSMANLSPSTVAKLSKNKPVDGKVLMRICAALQCQPGEVMEYTAEKSEGQ